MVSLLKPREVQLFGQLQCKVTYSENLWNLNLIFGTCTCLISIVINILRDISAKTKHIGKSPT